MPEFTWSHVAASVGFELSACSACVWSVIVPKLEGLIVQPKNSDISLETYIIIRTNL